MQGASRPIGQDENALGYFALPLGLLADIFFGVFFIPALSSDLSSLGLPNRKDGFFFTWFSMHIPCVRFAANKRFGSYWRAHPAP